MRQVVGDHSVDEVLTFGREAIAAQAKDLLQSLCDTYGIGISVQQLVLQDVNPPDPVKPSFNEVNEAIQEKEQLINRAWAEYNQEIPKAKGVAQQTIQEAEGYAAERVNRSQGEATRFEAIYAEYRKAPRVTRNRMYLETMNEILPRMGRKVILDEKQRGLIPLLKPGPGGAEMNRNLIVLLVIGGLVLILLPATFYTVGRDAAGRPHTVWGPRRGWHHH